MTVFAFSIIALVLTIIASYLNDYSNQYIKDRDE